MKTVQIKISSEELASLKGNGYKLCFAKKVGDNSYNVVWHAFDNYLSQNTFSWTPQYQLFGTHTFQANIRVQAQTNIVSIGLGQSSTLNSSGMLESPISGGPSNAITIENNYGPIHPGLNQTATGIDGRISSDPIYVAQKEATPGATPMIPVENILVWFQKHIETSTMISSIIGTPTEIDLTGTNSATRLYSNGKWTTE
ncbi:hypothetical protein [uncultured Psychroserpens sp.]|uniref:hypothetical protein n=1 Tax=uncultured Psychroserpens sp. TaxID=255436 RepID=UPI00260DBAA2|nr:hypothetical protein [uncultured Psychroserpens sp.]